MVKAKDKKVRCKLTVSSMVAKEVRRICNDSGITVSALINELILSDPGFTSFCKRGVTRHKKNGVK